jgi:hypothetical protein
VATTFWAKTLRQLALPALVLLALLLRLTGIQFGLPMLVHPDEWAVVNPATRMAVEGTLDPGFFNRPNHLSIYLSAALFGPASAMLFHESVARVSETSPWALHLVSRLVVVGFGTALVVAAYYLGREFSVRVGYILATLTAILPIYVSHSHFATPDIPLTLLVTLVMLFALRFLRTRSPWYIVLALVAAALSTIEKYPGVASLLAPVAVLGLALRGRPVMLAASLGATVIGFAALVVVLSPYLLLRSSDVIAALTIESGTQHLGADGLGVLGNLGFYATRFYREAGLIASVASAVGLVVLVKRRDARIIPLALSGVFWLGLSLLALHWERWALPMFVGPLALAAIGLDEVIGRMHPRPNRSPFAAAAVAIAIVLSVGAMGLSSASGSVALGLRDTRLAALEYLTRMGIQPDESIYDGYTPFQPGAPGTATWMLTPEAETSTRFAVISSFIYGRYLGDQANHPGKASFYRNLLSNEPLKTFAPARLAVADVQGGWWQGIQDAVPEADNASRAIRFLIHVATTQAPLNGPMIHVFHYPP